jgi:hypothetical protein
VAAGFGLKPASTNLTAAANPKDTPMSVSNSPTKSAPAALWPLLLRATRVIEAACFASLTAGAIVGLLGRLAMLLLTVAGGRSDNFAPLRFTLAGVLLIVVQPMVFGLPFALLVAALWRRVPGASARGKAMAAGVVSFVFPGLLLLTDSSFKLNPVNRTVGLALFAALYFSFGFLVGLAVNHWRQAVANGRWYTRSQPALWRWLLWGALFAGLYVVGVWAHGEAFG